MRALSGLTILALLSTVILLDLHTFFSGALTVDNVPDKTDALVVLAGDSDERVPVAAALYNEGRAPKIILTNDGVRSRWSRKHQRNLYSIEWNEEILLDSGVRPQDIIKLPFYRSGTIYDAQSTREFITKWGMKSFIIVTSDYHAKRAYWVFRQVFHNSDVTIGIHPVRSNYKGMVKTAFMQTLNYAKESVKFVYYRVRFGS